MKCPKFFLFVILFISVMNFTSSLADNSFGYNYLSGDTVFPSGNYTIDVNNTVYWQGHPFSYLASNYFSIANWNLNYTDFRPLINLSWWNTNYTANDAVWRSWSLNYSNYTNVAFTNRLNVFGAFNQTFDTSTLFIDSVSHRVGIGTISPTQKLHIESSTTDVRMLLKNSNSPAGGLVYELDGGAGGAAYLWNYENSPFYFGTNNINRLTILATGNVGIGTTSPARKFEVWGGEDTATTGTLTVGFNNVTIGALNTAGNVFFNIQNRVDADIFTVNASTNGNIIMNPSGNVGIGTLYPNQTLGVFNSGTKQIRMGSTGSNTSWWEIGRDNLVTGDLTIGNQVGEKMRITDGGKVGIGTTGPATPLQVNGEIRSIGTSAVVSLWDSTTTGNSRNWVLYSSDVAEGDLNIKVSTAAGGEPATGTSVLYMNKGGNVGIGTTAPSDALYVVPQNTAGGLTIAPTGAASQAYINLKGRGGSAEQYNTWIGTSNGNLRVGPDLSVLTSSTQGSGGYGTRMYQSGSNPYWYNLDVYDTTAATVGARVSGRSDSYFVGGNVGIGTASPIPKLDVRTNGTAGTGTVVAHFSNGISNDAGTEAQIGMQVSFTNPQLNSVYLRAIRGDGVQGQDHGFAINVTGGSAGGVNFEAFRIRPSGNVGINTTTPQNTLNVVGSINQSGTGNLTGNMIYGGIYLHNDTGVTMTFTLEDTWYNFTADTCGSLNGFICNISDGSLKAQMKGIYKVTYVATGIGGNNHLYHTGIAVNNVVKNNTQSHTLATASDTTSMAGVGHIIVDVGDIINLQIQDSSGIGSGIVYNWNMVLERIGN
jgi:hypothetical protein